MAVVSILDAFTYKWAQDGTAEAITDVQWKTGWAFIGATPPSVEQFNKWGQISDEKSNYLYAQLNTIYALTGVVPGAADVNSLRDSLRGTGLFQTAAKGTSDTKAATTEFVQVAVDSGPGKLVGNARNLRISQTAASTSVTITADEVVVKSALGGTGTLIPNFNKTINLATVGLNGMDVSVAPTSGWVAYFAVRNPTTNVNGLVARDATAAASAEIYGGANMPGGFTESALVAVLPTNASKQVPVLQQFDRLVHYYANVYAGAPGPGTFVSLSIAAGVPRNARAWRGNFALTPSVAGNVSAAICPTASGQGTPGYVSFGCYGAAALLVGSTIPDCPILTPQITFWASAALGAGTLAINSYGYNF